MNLRFIDPREAVLYEAGVGLDAIGSMRYVKLPRRDRAEADHDYRQRLIARLFGENFGEDLTPLASPPPSPTPQ
jgi:hypothetical protein